MANITRRPTGEERPALREWNPFDLFDLDPFRTMAPLLYGRETIGAKGGRGGFMPSFEVKEMNDRYVFKADVPGVKESDLDISVSGNTVTVSGKRESEEREEGETWYAYERSYGNFTRTFTLPEGADAEAAEAGLHDGVLTLIVPKRPEAHPKKIALKAKGVLESAVEKVKGALGKEKGEPAKA